MLMKKRIMSLFLALVMCMGLCTVAQAGGREAELQYYDEHGTLQKITIDLDDPEDSNSTGPMWGTDGSGNLTLKNFKGVSVIMDGGDGLILQGNSSVNSLSLRAYGEFSITVQGNGTLDADNSIDGKAAVQLSGSIKFSRLKVTGIRDGKNVDVTIPGPNESGSEITYTFDGAAATYVRIAPEDSQPSQPEFTAWELTEGKLTLLGNSPDFSSASKQPWASKSNEIREVIIGNGVTRIGAYAFSGCSNLRKVSFPKGIDIANAAFAGSGLESVIIPEKATLYNTAFAECSKLSWVYISGESLCIGGGNIFTGCNNLKDIYFEQLEEDLTLLELLGVSPKETTMHYNMVLDADGNPIPSTGPKPVDPDPPVEPEPPVEPDPPVEPPVDPDPPVDPKPPVEPEPPVIPPVYPSYPSNPVSPSKPSKPSKPAEETKEPETSEEPEESVEPETPVQPQEPVAPAPVYDDVAPDAWYSEAAAYVASKGLMAGTSEGNFSPNEQMTRAMVWTVLGRMAGADVDGSGNQWYAKAQAWAASGVSDGANPNGGVTRQELAVMLWRSAGSPEGTAEMSAFSDGGEVAEWASAAMRWAVANGVLNGDNGALKPGAPASRAEVAAMLMRFCEKMGL